MWVVNRTVGGINVQYAMLRKGNGARKKNWSVMYARMWWGRFVVNARYAGASRRNKRCVPNVTNAQGKTRARPCRNVRPQRAVRTWQRRCNWACGGMAGLAGNGRQRGKQAAAKWEGL